MRSLPLILLLALAPAPGALPALAGGDIEQYPACKYCGMDRQKYSHSRVLIDYQGGSGLGTCSLHCAAVDLAVNIDKIPQSIQVGDFDTRELVDAEKASWVLVPDKPGVMTARGKWAFATREAADRYAAANGGKVISFDEAMRAAYEDMDRDTKAIRERRKARREAAAAGTEAPPSSPGGK